MNYTYDNQPGIGVMTGTSLDAVDLILCRFRGFEFEILNFQSIRIEDDLQQKLGAAHALSVKAYMHLQNEFSEFLAKSLNGFHKSTGELATFAGIHGQTILHEPQNALTEQMINGGLIATKTGLHIVCDFRRGDVALGGQGAPLVPIGDRDLFGDYEACVNLGGFANVSYTKGTVRIAFDVCPVNYVLNHLSKILGKEFDDGGRIARDGKLDKELIEKLNRLVFYTQKHPKSLGREWVETEFFPLLNMSQPQDMLRTVTEHAAHQIVKILPAKGKVLITGGGAYNEFLIELIRQRAKSAITIPNHWLIEGKEALIFAYLAKLRLEGKPNILSEYTGAVRDSISGALYHP